MQLKPCPFCGDYPELQEWVTEDGITFFIVACENEDCPIRPFTQKYIRKKPAFDAWNTRNDDETGE